MRTNIKVGAIYTRRKLDEGDDLSVLSAAIKRDGLMHPILITGQYFLIDGLRRLQAMKLKDEDLVPAIVADTYDEAVDAIEESHANMFPDAIRKNRLWELQHDLHPLMTEGLTQLRRTPHSQRRKAEDNRSRKRLADALGVNASTLQVLSTFYTASLGTGPQAQLAGELLDKIRTDELTPHSAKGRWSIFLHDQNSVRKAPQQSLIMNGVTEVLPGVLNSLKELSSELDASIEVNDLARWENDLASAATVIRSTLNKVRRAKERI